MGFEYNSCVCVTLDDAARERLAFAPAPGAAKLEARYK